METAPIALFAYKRAEHLSRTIDALKTNVFASSSKLIIFSDGPKGDHDFEAVAGVRKYLKNIKGFKSVDIIERDSNWGLSKSIISGVTQVCHNFGRVIVLEDDLITSKYFLQFMNEALEKYKDQNEVVSINGYVYPVKKKLPENFFLKCADCWGWATWGRGWQVFEEDGRRLLQKLEDKNLIKKFNFDGQYDFRNMLEEQIMGKNDSWAIRWYASAFLADKLSLYPGRSLVHNIGNDSSGVNCGTSKAYDAVLNNERILINDIPLQENPYAFKQISNFFRNQKKESGFYLMCKRFEKFKKLIGFR